MGKVTYLNCLSLNFLIRKMKKAIIVRIKDTQLNGSYIIGV